MFCFTITNDFSFVYSNFRILLNDKNYYFELNNFSLFFDWDYVDMFVNLQVVYF